MREALAGNTSAGRLVLEHSGKLHKNIHITISSPFEQYLESQQGRQLEPSKEVIEAEVVPVEIQQEFQQIDRELEKKKAVLEKRRELYSSQSRSSRHRTNATKTPYQRATIRLGDEYYPSRR